MATRTATITYLTRVPPVVEIAWRGFTGSGDVGNLVSYPGLADKTIQFVGASGNTFGANLTAALYGGMINSIGVANILKDSGGSNISTNSQGTFTIADNPRYLAPWVTAASSGLAMDVIIIGTSPLR